MKPAQAVICLAAALLPAACTAGPAAGGATGPATGPAAASGHAPSGGTVAGRLVREGGPLGPNGQQPGLHPIPGTVRFTAGRDQVIRVRTSRAGTFSVHLPAGKYQVSDRSPRLLLVTADGKDHETWSRPVTVIVTAQHTTRITLTSIVP